MSADVWVDVLRDFVLLSGAVVGVVAIARAAGWRVQAAVSSEEACVRSVTELARSEGHYHGERRRWQLHAARQEDGTWFLVRLDPRGAVAWEGLVPDARLEDEVRRWWRGVR